MRMRMGRCAIALMSLAGCQALGVGSSTNEPPKGSVDRRYAKTPDDVSRAAAETLNELNMTVQGDEHDALGGQITATRATPSKEEVIVWYQSADARTTQVSVGVGKGDRGLAQLIHDHIAQKLGSPSAKSAPAVGACSDMEVDPPIAQCLSAAEQALKALKLDVSHKEIHDTWAQIEARQTDSVPVIVRMDRTEKDKTKVCFTAGTSKSQDTQQMADRVKAEFERNLSSAKNPG